MSDEELTLLEVVSGTAQAEALRGLLEAQGIHVLLSQESASSAIPVSFGILGEVKILVLEKDLARAKQVLDEYYAGDFEDQNVGDKNDNEATG